MRIGLVEEPTELGNPFFFKYIRKLSIQLLTNDISYFVSMKEISSETPRCVAYPINSRRVPRTVEARILFTQPICVGLSHMALRAMSKPN